MGTVVAELLKKFIPPYGIRRAVTTFKTADHCNHTLDHMQPLNIFTPNYLELN